MKVISLSFVVLVLSGLLGGCTDPGAQPATSFQSRELSSTCACDAIFPRTWSSDFRGYWPSDATSMMVIFTGTGDGFRDAFFAWGVADASRVAWMLKIAVRDYQDFQVHMNRAFQLAHELAPQRYWGGGGGLGGGGPGPIGPVGVPPDYTARIIRTAGSITDATQATLEFAPPR